MPEQDTRLFQQTLWILGHLGKIKTLWHLEKATIVCLVENIPRKTSKHIKTVCVEYQNTRIKSRQAECENSLISSNFSMNILQSVFGGL